MGVLLAEVVLWKLFGPCLWMVGRECLIFLLAESVFEPLLNSQGVVFRPFLPEGTFVLYGQTLCSWNIGAFWCKWCWHMSWGVASWSRGPTPLGLPLVLACSFEPTPFCHPRFLRSCTSKNCACFAPSILHRPLRGMSLCCCEKTSPPCDYPSYRRAHPSDVCHLGMATSISPFTWWFMVSWCWRRGFWSLVWG